MTSTDAQTQDNQAQLDSILRENEELKESIADIKTMFSMEDAGWRAITGFTAGDREEPGLSLDEVQSIAEKARPKTAGAGLVKRGSDLHGGFVWGKGVEIDDTLREKGKTGPVPKSVQFFEDPVNQESIFSGAAQRELQRERFVAGNVIVFCEQKTRKVRRVPIEEISGYMSNPDFNEEVWAWQRSWTSYNPRTGKPEEKKAWVYTNRFSGARKKSLPDGSGKPVPVLENVTAVDLRANRQVGWAFGVPDATAGLLWCEAYAQVMQYGQIVNESLAKLIFKVVQKTKKGAQNTAVKLSNANEFGGAGVVGEGQDIQLVNSSMSAYKFSESRPLAAMAASAWNLSSMDLLSDSSAAGSSYGSAQALTEGIRNAMIGMQNEWSQFLQDIFAVCGLGRPGIHWPAMDTPDAYRQAQELLLYRPALHDAEFRAIVLDRLDYPGDPNDIPTLLAAQTAGAEFSMDNPGPDADPDPGNNGAQAASPDQGRNNGTGGQQDADKRDLQND